MLIQQTLDKLLAMKLKGLAEGYREQLRRTDLDSLTFDERFGLLVDQEWLLRQNRRLARRLREAKLRLPASVEDLDYATPRGLERSLVSTLASCHWLTERQNVLISGPTGVGKTFLLCALANAAIRQGFTARYYRLPRLIGDLGLTKADGSYPRFMAKLAKTDLVVLDDWGLSPLSAGEARDLLEVMDDRYQSRSTAVASQLPMEDWHATIADPSVADAILDRLVHNAHKLNLKGESMRKIKNLAK